MFCYGKKYNWKNKSRIYIRILDISIIYQYLKSLSPTAPLFFRLNGSECPPSATPQACIIIPDLLLLHMAGEEGEGGTARTGGREGAKRRRCSSGEGSGAQWRSSCYAKKARRKHRNTRSSTQSKQGGGWWELECQSDVTEDGRSILTALTARADRARQQIRPQETGEGHGHGRHKERTLSTSALVASPFSPPLPHSDVHIIQLNSVRTSALQKRSLSKAPLLPSRRFQR